MHLVYFVLYPSKFVTLIQQNTQHSSNIYNKPTTLNGHLAPLTQYFYHFFNEFLSNIFVPHDLTINTFTMSANILLANC